MNAGRELDVLIAKTLFGIKPFVYAEISADSWYYIPSGKPKRTHMIDAHPLPRFSTDIAAAWTIVERFHSQRCFVQIASTADGTWTVQLGSVAYIEAATMPLALCHAGLIAAPQMPDWPSAVGAEVPA